MIILFSQRFWKKIKNLAVFETELLVGGYNVVLKRQKCINNSHSSYLAELANQKDKGMNVGRWGASVTPSGINKRNQIIACNAL